MGRRLIITHGERTTQHELADRALVIGRDPGCDIFFIDQKLSRRHARIEPAPDGVALIDLGSRNGTWVNEQLVEQHLLRPGDQVRVGGLRILYQEDPASAPAGAGDSTIVLDTSADAADRTVVLGGAPDPAESPESTLMLGGSDAPPAEPLESGTVAVKTGVYPPRSEPEFRTQSYQPLSATAETEKVPVPPPLPAPAAPAPPPTAEPSRFAMLRERAKSAPLSLRIAAMLFAIGLIPYLIAVLPLVSRLRTSMESESIERGRTLLRFLAAVNEPVLADRKFQELTTDVVMAEPGVKDALILDVNGRVLAPSIRSNESHETIEGINKKVAEIHAPASGRTKSGDVNFVEPLVEKSRRIGFAALTYSPRTQASATSVILFGILAIAAGAWAASVLLHKLVVGPVTQVRNAVDAVIRGDAPFVDPSQPYPELSNLAESLNLLIDAPPPKKGSISVTLASTDVVQPIPRSELPATVVTPVLAPTLIGPNPGQTARENELVVDENFVVTRVHPTALGILDSTLVEVEGKHLIEAIREQKLLELVLDLVNGLATNPSTSGECEIEDAGTVRATAQRRGQDIVVTLQRP